MGAASRLRHPCLSSACHNDVHALVQGKKIMTPPLDGTILPGVTRGSVLQLATMLGYEASEEKISVQDALAADEVFTTGMPPCVIVGYVRSFWLLHCFERFLNTRYHA